MSSRAPGERFERSIWSRSSAAESGVSNEDQRRPSGSGAFPEEDVVQVAVIVIPEVNAGIVRGGE